MIKIRQIISTYTSTRIFSLLLLLIVSATTHAQSKMFRMEKDSIPLFRGFAVSFDLVGPMMMALSDHGEIEGALRINLHDQWFPVFELGLGRANHENDKVTGITYKTTAPYFRVGMDWNIMKTTVCMRVSAMDSRRISWTLSAKRCPTPYGRTPRDSARRTWGAPCTGWKRCSALTPRYSGPCT